MSIHTQFEIVLCASTVTIMIVVVNPDQKHLESLYNLACVQLKTIIGLEFKFLSFKQLGYKSLGKTKTCMISDGIARLTFSG